MKRWLVIITAGSGYNQKYPPDTLFFKTKRHAEGFLRSKIKTFVGLNITHLKTISEFLESNCITHFETNEGEFFLKEVDIE